MLWMIAAPVHGVQTMLWMIAAPVHGVQTLYGWLQLLSIVSRHFMDDCRSCPSCPDTLWMIAALVHGVQTMLWMVAAPVHGVQTMLWMIAAPRPWCPDNVMDDCRSCHGSNAICYVFMLVGPK